LRTKYLLRRIFEPKREKVTREWRESNVIKWFVIFVRYFSINRSETFKFSIRGSSKSNADTVLMKRSDGKKLFGEQSRRWEDNIKINLLEIGCDWVELALGRAQ
jgi:hypothetical protein